MPYRQRDFGLGGAMSSDSRYLYIMKTFDVYQYDLKAPDPFATEKIVAVHDGYLEDNFWVTGFFPAQLGPDGRIYIAATVVTKSLHRINFPNRAGTACQVQQRAIPLRVYNQYCIPNMPNFRLGPIDGSSCDTLGLNNIPLADFRWDVEDTLAPLRLTFTDLTAYQPAQWTWDFGDGRGRSTQTEPVYTYAQPGVYRVCLTARNPNGQHTACYNVPVGQPATPTVTATDEAEEACYALSPNPADSDLWWQRRVPADAENWLECYNAVGQLVHSQGLAAGQDRGQITTTAWQNGLYFYRIRTQDRLLQSGTIAIQH